jgi:RHS repeat-associated protein
MTSNPLGQMTYDVENRLTSVSGENYGYDPSNKRIQKQLTNGTEEIHFYGARGERLGIYNLQINGSSLSCGMSSLNIYFGGKRIGRVYSYGNTSFVGLDRLGSDGGLNSYPWGEEKTTTTQNTDKFATYYRDGTGLDYADQRYYSSIMGRFLTPDPYKANNGASGDPAEPQSWNRYAYVLGDPVNYYDPEGLVAHCPPGTHVVQRGQSFGCLLDPTPPPDLPTPTGPGDPAVPGTPKVGGDPHPPICDKPILQPTYTSIFIMMGNDLGTDPAFFAAIALQESGWDLSHVYGTNASSGGQPLNNLFGATYGGGDNIAYPSVKASAIAWEKDWGYLLTDHPTTIKGFVSDLLKDPHHMYNSSPNWPISIEGGNYVVGPLAARHKSTPGTYNSILNAWDKCGMLVKPQP